MAKPADRGDLLHWLFLICYLAIICGFLGSNEIRRSENVAVASLGSGGLGCAVGERIPHYLPKERRIDIRIDVRVDVN